MGALFDELKAFFGRMGWPVNAIEEQQILSFSYQGTHGQWVFILTVNEETRVVTMLSRAPIACPPERRSAVAELVLRANFGMSHGALDLDLDDGEIRFRTGADLSGLELVDANLAAVARYNVLTMDIYLPVLKAVIDGEASPEEALATIYT